MAEGVAGGVAEDMAKARLMRRVAMRRAGKKQRAEVVAMVPEGMEEKRTEVVTPSMEMRRELQIQQESHSHMGPSRISLRLASSV